MRKFTLLAVLTLVLSEEIKFTEDIYRRKNTYLLKKIFTCCLEIIASYKMINENI